MPYLRLYSEQDLPVEQKRVIAQRLIEITLRTFHLRAEQRNRITIQFIASGQVRGVNGIERAIPRAADFALEVLGRDLTERKKRAFAEDIADMVVQLVPMKPRNRIARLLGRKADTPRQVALQFNELSPAISDPFVVEAERLVA